jgi:hypothetical protein
MKKISHPIGTRILRQIATGAALAACACMLGCAESSPTSSGGTGTPTPAEASAVVTVCNETPNGCSQDTSFSLATIRDLSVHVQWSNVAPGTQTQSLQLLDPGGGSYQVTNSSFVVADGSAGQASTDVLIPVSGSMITQRQITGTWTMQLMLNGKPIATEHVILQP